MLGLGVRFYDPFMVFKTVGSSRVLTSDPTLNHQLGSGQPGEKSSSAGQCRLRKDYLQDGFCPEKLRLSHFPKYLIYQIQDSGVVINHFSNSSPNIHSLMPESLDMS